MNPSKHAVGKMDQLQRALMIRRSLGVKVAAAYMRNTGWSVEAALYWLTRPLVGASLCR